VKSLAVGHAGEGTFMTQTSRRAHLRLHRIINGRIPVIAGISLKVPRS
jgi:dihydrodipicolinate synthase/N-acetylneuraminate lyase